MTEAAVQEQQVRVGQATLRLKLGDLTAESADALVNAANAQLAGGGGVDGALHRAGGPAIAEECRRIRAERGGCPPGEAVATTAGYLKARALIHTVGPIWQGGTSGEDAALRRAYQNSLALAVERGLRTVAFPSISTGAYGFPVDRAARVALAAIADFLLSPSGRDLSEVRLVLHSPQDLAAYRAALAELPQITGGSTDSGASPPGPATPAPPPRPGVAVEAEITGLAHDGAGVGRMPEGYVLFIPGALPGERVEAQVEQAGPRSGRARMVRLLTVSPDRVPPEAQNCAVTEGCGGCSLGHLSYPAQLAFKTRRVTEALQRIGRLPEAPVAPCLAAPLTEGYRNKMQYVVFAGDDGRLRLGQLAAGTHDPVPAEDCRLAAPALRVAAAQLSQALTAWAETFAKESSDLWPRHAVLREASATGELMAILVTREGAFPGWDELAADLQRRLPRLVSLVQLVNPRPAGAVLAGRRARVAGRSYLVERLGELTFHLSPESFLQVNPAQTAHLYDQVRSFAGLTGAEDLLDVYCGIGTISLYLARSARHVTGIEVIPAAVEDAAATARLNGLANTSFLAGPAERLLPDLARRGQRPQVVVVDPPRAGVAPEALAALASLRPARIVYVSCDPETLARDLRRLADSGYHLRAVQPVDMFPQTSHTEAVAVVTRE